MVAFDNDQLDTARVRISRHEAMLIVTAITVGVSHNEPPACCKEGIEAFVNRLLDAFGMTFQVDPATGDLLVDGVVIARIADE